MQGVILRYAIEHPTQVITHTLCDSLTILSVEPSSISVAEWEQSMCRVSHDPQQSAISILQYVCSRRCNELGLDVHCTQQPTYLL